MAKDGAVKVEGAGPKKTRQRRQATFMSRLAKIGEQFEGMSLVEQKRMLTTLGSLYPSEVVVTEDASPYQPEIS